jgi:hypothetical protein
MSEDGWEVGALAECRIGGARDNGLWSPRGQGPGTIQGPKKGDVNRVEHVGTLQGVQVLYFSRYPGRGFAASHFRKLKPPRVDDTYEACEPWFKRLVKHSQPARPTVDA